MKQAADIQWATQHNTADDKTLQNKKTVSIYNSN
jgi:hypothetical protein